MATKRILDEVTKKALLGYLPFDVNQTTELVIEDIPIKEFQPKFHVRCLTQSEALQLRSNSTSLSLLDSASKDYGDRAHGLLDATADLIRSCVMGWSNLYDVGTAKEIEFKSDIAGGADKDLYRSLPVWMKTKIVVFCKKISGLTQVEELGLK